MISINDVTKKIFYRQNFSKNLVYKMDVYSMYTKLEKKIIDEKYIFNQY